MKPAQKKELKSKRKRTYKSLAVFNRECPKKGSSGNVCDLTNIRRLKNGEGLAVVRSTYPGGDENIQRRGGKPSGQWLLHFASFDVMKDHLRGRVDPVRSGMLDGTRRR